MPDFEFKRGPLKGRSFAARREGGYLVFVQGAGDLNSNGEISKWAIFGGDNQGISISHGSGEVEAEKGFFPTKKIVRMHPSGIVFEKDTGKGYTTYEIFSVDYISPNRMIYGFFEELKENTAIERSFSTKIILKGSKSFELNFVTESMGEMSIEFPLQRRENAVLKQAISEYLRFLQDLEFDPLFEGVRVVTASTHPRLAGFAVRQLGFHPNRGDSYDIDKEDPNSSRRVMKIVGTREELIANKDKAYAIYKWLNK